MASAVETFKRIIDRHLDDGVRMPVPDYAKVCVMNEYGYAYFTHQGKVKAMNYSTAIFLINDDVLALYVRYEVGDRSQKYMVKTFDKDIQVGDYVIVPSSGPNGHLAIAVVCDVDIDVDFDSMSIVPWVVQKIDLAPFNETVQQENAAIAAIREARFQERREELASTLMNHKKIKSLPLAKKKERGVYD